MIPIQNASFDASVNVTGTSSGFYIRMKSPSQLFYLDNTTYSYEGQRTVRGMLCDVYISKRTDFTLPYIPWNFTSTFEFYFLSNSWTQQNNIGKTAILQNTPVQLVISTPDSVAYQATYNIYNWVPEDPSFNRFDVTSCYDTNSQQSFILEWPGSWDSSIAQYQNQFVRAVTQTIVRLAHVNPIRVQKPTFKFDPTNIYFVATLLDAPPPMAYFTKMSNSYQQTTNDATLSVTSPDDCARACNTGSCMSFDFCLSNSVCALSTTHAQKGQIVGTATCDHYDRTVDYQSLSIPLAKVWTTLKNSVLIGDFQFSLPINGQNVQFTAGAIDNNVIQNAQRQLPSQALMDQFVQQINKDIPGYDDLIITGVAIDDCATGCLSQQRWVCNSFSYCFDTGYCILSKLHPDARPSAVVNKPLCDLYSRKYYPSYTGSAITVPAVTNQASTIPPVTCNQASTIPPVTSSAKQSPTAASSKGLVTKTSTQRTTRSSPRSSTTRSSTARSRTTSYTVSASVQQGSNTQASCQNLQTSSTNSGLTAGVAVATFCIGVLLGVLGLYLFTRRRYGGQEARQILENIQMDR